MARRTALLGLLALLLALLPVPAQGRPGAGAEAMQIADAAWFVREPNGERVFYFAAALRMAPAVPDGALTVAFVGKGKCFTHKDKNFRIMICSASGRGKIIPFEDFEFDPLLDSAHMRLEQRAVLNAVDWTGVGDVPAVSAGVDVGQDYIGGGGGMARGATASGDVLGTQLSSDRHDFAFLAQGISVGAWLDSRGYRLTDDGRLIVRQVSRSRI